MQEGQLVPLVPNVFIVAGRAVSPRDDVVLVRRLDTLAVSFEEAVQIAHRFLDELVFDGYLQRKADGTLELSDEYEDVRVSINSPVRVVVIRARTGETAFSFPRKEAREGAMLLEGEEKDLDGDDLGFDKPNATTVAQQIACFIWVARQLNPHLPVDVLKLIAKLVHRESNMFLGSSSWSGLPSSLCLLRVTTLIPTYDL